ncbi:hypothetical protein JCM6882_007432 [Rhodosporidiobolus microsporus]
MSHHGHGHGHEPAPEDLHSFRIPLPHYAAAFPFNLAHFAIEFPHTFVAYTTTEPPHDRIFEQASREYWPPEAMEVVGGQGTQVSPYRVEVPAYHIPLKEYSFGSGSGRWTIPSPSLHSRQGMRNLVAAGPNCFMQAAGINILWSRNAHTFFQGRLSLPGYGAGQPYTVASWLNTQPGGCLADCLLAGDKSASLTAELLDRPNLQSGYTPGTSVTWRVRYFAGRKNETWVDVKFCARRRARLEEVVPHPVPHQMPLRALGKYHPARREEKVAAVLKDGSEGRFESF